MSRRVGSHRVTAPGPLAHLPPIPPASKSKRQPPAAKNLRWTAMAVASVLADAGHQTANVVASQVARAAETQCDNDASPAARNARRRVYDALKVMAAVGSVDKSGDDIRWIGVDHLQRQPTAAEMQLSVLQQDGGGKNGAGLGDGNGKDGGVASLQVPQKVNRRGRPSKKKNELLRQQQEQLRLQLQLGKSKEEIGGGGGVERMENGGLKSGGESGINDDLVRNIGRNSSLRVDICKCRNRIARKKTIVAALQRRIEAFEQLHRRREASSSSSSSSPPTSSSPSSSSSSSSSSAAQQPSSLCRESASTSAPSSSIVTTTAIATEASNIYNTAPSTITTTITNEDINNPQKNATITPSSPPAATTKNNPPRITFPFALVRARKPDAVFSPDRDVLQVTASDPFLLFSETDVVCMLADRWCPNARKRRARAARIARQRLRAIAPSPPSFLVHTGNVNHNVDINDANGVDDPSSSHDGEDDSDNNSDHGHGNLMLGMTESTAKTPSKENDEKEQDGLIGDHNQLPSTLNTHDLPPQTKKLSTVKKENYIVSPTSKVNVVKSPLKRKKTYSQSQNEPPATTIRHTTNKKQKVDNSNSVSPINKKREQQQQCQSSATVDALTTPKEEPEIISQGQFLTETPSVAKPCNSNTNCREQCRSSPSTSSQSHSPSQLPRPSAFPSLSPPPRSPQHVEKRARAIDKPSLSGEQAVVVSKEQRDIDGNGNINSDENETRQENREGRVTMPKRKPSSESLFDDGDDDNVDNVGEFAHAHGLNDSPPMMESDDVNMMLKAEDVIVDVDVNGAHLNDDDDGNVDINSHKNELNIYQGNTNVKTEIGSSSAMDDAVALMNGDALSLPLFGDEDEHNNDVDGCLVAGDLRPSVTVTGIMSFLPPPETAFEHMEPSDPESHHHTLGAV